MLNFGFINNSICYYPCWFRGKMRGNICLNFRIGLFPPFFYFCVCAPFPEDCYLVTLVVRYIYLIPLFLLFFAYWDDSKELEIELGHLLFLFPFVQVFQMLDWQVLLTYLSSLHQSLWPGMVSYASLTVLGFRVCLIPSFFYCTSSVICTVRIGLGQQWKTYSLICYRDKIMFLHF